GDLGEELGRGIYEGMWVGKDWDIANSGGVRRDVGGVVKEVEIGVVVAVREIGDGGDRKDIVCGEMRDEGGVNGMKGVMETGKENKGIKRGEKEWGKNGRMMIQICEGEGNG
ncbi:hypothetical protein, partial [Bacillus velezensis]|uniref:hypothetical protein n=1 Tax=Bacillus velezensis TaxID=492670 RepID=UPI001C92FC81